MRVSGDGDNTWPGGVRHAMHQDEHEAWNAGHYPGTRKLCDECDEPTGRCEEDSHADDDGNVYCDECWDAKPRDC